MVNFYHRFIPGIAGTMQPLFQALSGKPKALNWLPEMEAAFVAAKQALANAALLVFPSVSSHTSLTVDASDTAVGAALEQFQNGEWRPLAFFSRQLRPAERKYSAFDRELLGLYLAIRHFRYFLEGRVFTAFTDHKPLTFAFAKVSDPWSARQQRHLTAISEYTTDIRHVSGKANVVVDALSRCSLNAINPVQDGIDFSAMAAAQQEDRETQLYRTSLTGMNLQDIPIGTSGRSLLCDTSRTQPRPIVPVDLRRHVFDALHGLAHPSVRTTQKLICDRYVWHGMRKQIGEWAKTCIPCQQAKVQFHTRAPLADFKIPARRFDHVNIDLVGPLPTSQGATHLLTIIDRFTRWPEAVPLSSTDTTSCARAFIMHWVARFGVPLDITSDRGPQFISALWTDMSRLLGTHLHWTAAYHPQANGMVERFHRHLKSALRARLTGPNWMDELPWILLGIRTAPKEDLDCSSAELVFGAPLTVPGDFVHAPETPTDPTSVLPALRSRVGLLSPTPTSRHCRPRVNVPPSLADSAFVFMRRDAHKTPLERPYEGPFKVLEHGDKTFKLQLGNSTDNVSIDRLKPAHLDIDRPVQVAQPRRKGRPPKRSAATGPAAMADTQRPDSDILIRHRYI